MNRARPWTLYRRTRNVSLDRRLFKSPTSEYRGVPFWSWNNRLDKDALLRQIEQFREMGFGGVNIHARTGLDTEYLGDEFMAIVRACTQRLSDLGMLSWLYDEDRWPSGFAGGLVTKDVAHRARHLLWTPVPYGKGPPVATLTDYSIGRRSENGRLLARYAVTLRDGRLHRHEQLAPNQRAPKGATVWYAYVETSPPGRWFGGQTYSDVFSTAAVQRFIETTHERYRETVGDFFGSAVPAIFTDEPQFVKKQTLGSATELRDVLLPWSEDFTTTFSTAFNAKVLDTLPELFWNLPDDAPSVTRWRYHEHTAERFSAAFGDTIGKWCDSAGIALTGHLLGEGNLHSQTRGIGEAMRPLRSFHLPGIDMLCDRYEWATAKQAQSVAHQLGRPGVLSEMYGVTNWDFDFVGHKAQGDWQAALGVTVRVPHLAWGSMAGESKRDYPAAIGYQSPWWREYPLIEDHFARVNTVLSRGQPIVRVAVIHPLESYWLAWGPAEHNQPEWVTRENQLNSICEILLKGMIDFDFVSEGMLADLTPAKRSSKSKQFTVGRMKYDAVLLPNLKTIRSSTLRAVSEFAEGGGRVVFAGGVPSLVDVRPSSAPARLAKRAVVTEFNRQPILDALREVREVEVRNEDGSPSDSIIHQLRDDGSKRLLFLVNTDRQRPRNRNTIIVRGNWRATQLDTFTGDVSPCSSNVERGVTHIPWSFSAHGHLLLELAPSRTSRNVRVVDRKQAEYARVDAPVAVTLSEPNVLLLDQCEWQLNDGPWQPREEILRIDNIVRKQLGLPSRAGRLAQPWTDSSPSPAVASLKLRFHIESDIAIAAPKLALEEAAAVSITLDGRRVDSTVNGWWVDEAIHTVALPRIDAGKHELVLTIPVSRKANVEWCYLLGDFGVRVAGREARIVAPVRTLQFGDWCGQGLPFYAGNVTYHCSVTGDGREVVAAFPKFRSPLLSVALDGEVLGKVAFAPFEIALGALRGEHRLDVTAYGNRINAFGCLHHTDDNIRWVGPDAWRSTGAAWCYEYNLRKMGLLTAPIVRVIE